jgi:uncharacterized Ntn-hydrolase superfamily protein
LRSEKRQKLYQEFPRGKTLNRKSRALYLSEYPKMMSRSRAPRPSTFSIVAFDFGNGDLGVAVQSKFPAVGAVVPWARARVGAIATQAWCNTTYGPNGLGMLERGLSAQETLRILLADDKNPQVRQFAVVDAKGQVAVHTGTECFEWAGHVTGEGYSCQGNILAGAKVVESMARAYEEETGDLIDKLMQALSAGQASGGDRRGQQSAALLVVREKGGYEGFTDRYVDLRVDDHPTPIEELKRVLKVYDMTMLSREDPKNLLTIGEGIAVVLQKNLTKLGMYKGAITGMLDDATRKALNEFVNTHNFENRMHEEGRIWKSILDYMSTLASEA